MPGLLERSARTCIAIVFAAILSISLAASALAEEFLTAEDILKIAPKAKPEFIQAMIDAKDEFEDAELNEPIRMAHFMSQVMTETGGLKRIDENMNYSFKSLMRVFSRKTVSEADARRIARKPREVANWVYGARLGNRGRNTDDGWNYRGSGFIQLTGRDNFIRRGEEVGLPLAENPELAREAKAGLTAAIAFWKANNINAAADANDRIRVRKLVNGPAAHGKEQARTFFNRAWRDVFRGKEGTVFEGSGDILLAEDLTDELMFDDILKQGGYIDEGFAATESGAAEARADALRDFQETWELPVTGQLDEATQEALLDPRMWRLKSLEDEELDVEDTPQTDEPHASGNPEGSTKFSFGSDGDAEVSAVTPSVGMESGAAAMIEAFKGSGQTVANVNMKQEDILRLSEASGIYANYEMGDKAPVPETFVPFSVVGDDDRVAVMNTTQFPARAMVQITFKNHRGKINVCSGTMISPDTVLTAAHCIHSGTSGGKAYSEFRFIPGRNVGAAPFGECNARDAFVLNGWVETDSIMDARNFDLGAFKLDCQIGEVTGQLAIRVLADDELGVPTTVHGYAVDKAPPGRQWVSKDELRVLQDLKGFYHNDTYGGTSGSGVYVTSQPDTLIGVHTNGLHGEEPWKSHNAFTRITQDRLAQIQDWIAQ